MPVQLNCCVSSLMMQTLVCLSIVLICVKECQLSDDECHVTET